MMDKNTFTEIVNNFGTPTYVLDLDVLKSRLSDIREILGDGVELLYAMKANPFLVPYLIDSGVHFEVCSPGEMSICESVGVPMERIVLSGVNKEPLDIAHVMGENGSAGIYTVESIRHFQLLSSQAKAHGLTIDVLLRVTGGNQFGLDEADIDRLVSRRGDFPNVNIIGLQAYTGTQKKKMEVIEQELDWLVGICDHLKAEYGFEVEKLEYGPGLMVEYFLPGVQNQSLDDLVRLSAKLEVLRGRCGISLEMGRYIAASCGYYLTRVEDMKVNKGQNYLIVDGGINHVNYYGQTMAMKVPVIRHIPMEQEKTRELELDDNEAALGTGLAAQAQGTADWNVCGSLCTVGDVLVKKLPLENVSLGDLLVFENIGAYSITEGIYLFLSRDMPNVVVYDGAQGARLVRKRRGTWGLNCAE
jgi:diaminopimelate decarboxylase